MYIALLRQFLLGRIYSPYKVKHGTTLTLWGMLDGHSDIATVRGTLGKKCGLRIKVTSMGLCVLLAKERKQLERRCEAQSKK